MKRTDKKLWGKRVTSATQPDYGLSILKTSSVPQLDYGSGVNVQSPAKIQTGGRRLTIYRAIFEMWLEL